MATKNRTAELEQVHPFDLLHNYQSDILKLQLAESFKCNGMYVPDFLLAHSPTFDMNSVYELLTFGEERFNRRAVSTLVNTDRAVAIPSINFALGDMIKLSDTGLLRSLYANPIPVVEVKLANNKVIYTSSNIGNSAILVAHLRGIKYMPVMVEKSIGNLKGNRFVLRENGIYDECDGVETLVFGDLKQEKALTALILESKGAKDAAKYLRQ